VSHHTFRPRVEALEDRLTPTTFNVTNTRDAGAGSLRQAITQANAMAGADVINFNIGTGGQKIKLLSALPAITETVTINATTQPGFTNNPLIVLDGSAAGAGVDGLTIAPGANDCVITGLVIKQFAGNGIVIQSNHDSVLTCFIGTNAAGSVAAPNGKSGILITGTATNNIIGSNLTGLQNLIGGNGQYGILLSGAGVTGNTIQRNYIGASADGTKAISNHLDGVALVGGAHGNTIGGLANAGSFIVGNLRYGITVSGAGTSGNIISANIVGSNNLGGIRIVGGASNNTIGGTSAGLGNIVSANGRAGVLLSGVGVTGNVLVGNLIGTASSGTTALPNLWDGVMITGGATNNTIGGSTAGTTNLISGNKRFGINITGAGTTGNVVAGNVIGLDVGGTTALANGAGIQVASGANGNTIGGTTTAAINAISGNTKFGILVSGANNTLIEGNRIGTKADGTGAVGNGSHGIFVTGKARGTTIGGTATGAGNTIANNGGDGVLVGSDPRSKFTTPAGKGNAVLGNSIFANTKLGIDLGPNDGVTRNDPGDTDGSPNDLQNFPSITTASVITNGTQVQIQISLNSQANTTYRIEFFANTMTSSSGHGQGQNFLGFIEVTTDATGKATGTGTFTYTSTLGANLSATATNKATNDTSEFSHTFIV
jgi:titin